MCIIQQFDNPYSITMQFIHNSCLAIIYFFGAISRSLSYVLSPRRRVSLSYHPRLEKREKWRERDLSTSKWDANPFTIHSPCIRLGLLSILAASKWLQSMKWMNRLSPLSFCTMDNLGTSGISHSILSLALHVYMCGSPGKAHLPKLIWQHSCEILLRHCVGIIKSFRTRDRYRTCVPLTIKELPSPNGYGLREPF